MAQQVDYYLSLVSPYTYMGHGQFEKLAQSTGVQVNYRPADIMKIFSQTGGVPLAKRSPQRQAYRMMDLKRWKAWWGLPMNLTPKYFPAPDTEAAKVVIAATASSINPGPLIGNYLKAVWEQDRNIADAGTIRDIITETGLDADALTAAAQSSQTQAAFDDNTAYGLEAGVFGAPTWVVDGEVFWGQDRLYFLELALTTG